MELVPYPGIDTLPRRLWKRIYTEEEKALQRARNKKYVVSWGPDSRHLHESTVHQTVLTARVQYAHDLDKAKKLVRIEYEYRMSNGDKITVLSEQIA